MISPQEKEQTRSYTSTPLLTKCSLHLLPLLAAFTVAGASTVGWYRMEGTPDTPVGTVTNSSGPAANAIAEGASFNYASAVAGSSIYDPISDTTYANTSSTAFNGGTAHSELTVTNPAGSGPLNQADFTVEMLIRLDSRLTTGEPYLVTHGSVTTDGWGIRVRNPENAPIAFVNNGSVWDGGSEPDVLLDGSWHHLAIVVKTSDDGNTENYAKFYLDYELIREVGSSNPLNTYDPTVSGSLKILTEDYIGYIDEFRYSDSLLESNQFLVAIPEPGTLTLFGIGFMGLLFGMRGPFKK
ncbi:PEP-CTERM sorting domain-containing protein [Kiritimatiellaeota bacterium B1221]|nr:PEP-CTERM sorting domain-containing protein [Kiritimatiellaeota bacterium B1221]